MSQFDEISAYVESTITRVLAANHAVRAKHPVWISVNIPYRLRTTATTALDVAVAEATVIAYINGFNSADVLDVSDISTIVRASFGVVGAVYPLEIAYHLDSPDGQQLFYLTTDIVSIFDTDLNGVELQNGGDVTPTPQMQEDGSTGIFTKDELNTYLYQLGVSDRTVTYRTAPGMVTFEQRG